jgi:hypothetical protein
MLKKFHEDVLRKKSGAEALLGIAYWKNVTFDI